MTTLPNGSQRHPGAGQAILIAAGIAALAGLWPLLPMSPDPSVTLVAKAAPGPDSIARARAAGAAEWREADAGEFAWLSGIYGAQAESEGLPLTAEGQPFRIGKFPGHAGDEGWYLVLWPRICLRGACRVDVLLRGKGRVMGSAYVSGARPADAFHAGRPLVADAAGRVGYWGGSNYTFGSED